MSKQIKMLNMNEINPYIRYVNFRTFKEETFIPERKIYDHEFIYCLSGKASFIYQDKNFNLEKGDLFYIRPGICNTMIVSKGYSFKAHCVHFDWTIPNKADDFFVENTYLHMVMGPDGIYHPAEKERFSRPNPEFEFLQHTPFITGLSYDFIAPIFRMLYLNYQGKRESSHLMQKALFLQIIAHICERTQDTKLSSSLNHQKIVFEAIHYIQEYFNDDLNLPLLAEHVGLSPKYFGQIFIAQTGIDVHTYLTDIRITQVKYLLTHTDDKLDHIATTCGFNDKFYLSKVFKQKVGMTTSEYRKLYQ